MIKLYGKGFLNMNGIKLNKAKMADDEITWISLFCLLIILLTLLQDYLSAQWNNNSFYLIESLLFKVFWLFFIPFYVGFKNLTAFLKEVEPFHSSNSKPVIYLAITPLVFGFLHLFVFAFFLFLISTLIHTNGWELSMLIKEKLSSRMFITLPIYLIFGIYELRKQNKTGSDIIKYRSTLTIKNGSKSTIIDSNSIKWVSAQNGYLELHTNKKKHVILDSLKNFIKELNPDQFKRIHKSTIVNIQMIDTLKSRHNGDYDVVLKDGNELRLSRNYTKPLRGELL